MTPSGSHFSLCLHPKYPEISCDFWKLLNIPIYLFFLIETIVVQAFKHQLHGQMFTCIFNKKMFFWYFSSWYILHCNFIAF